MLERSALKQNLNKTRPISRAHTRMCVCESHKTRPISCVCVCVCVCKSVIFCDSMDCSPPGSSVHRIFQARIIGWIAIPFSGDLPDPGAKPSSPELQAYFVATEPPGKPVGTQFTVRKGCPGAVCALMKAKTDSAEKSEHRADRRPEPALAHLAPVTHNVSTQRT